jgi:hypothetical protein
MKITKLQNYFLKMRVIAMKTKFDTIKAEI